VRAVDNHASFPGFHGRASREGEETRCPQRCRRPDPLGQPTDRQRPAACGCDPRRYCSIHGANGLEQRGNRRSSHGIREFPTPAATESRPMPAHQRWHAAAPAVRLKIAPVDSRYRSSSGAYDAYNGSSTRIGVAPLRKWVGRNTMSKLTHSNRVATAGERSAAIAHEANHPLIGIATRADVGLRRLSGGSPHRVTDPVESMQGMQARRLSATCEPDESGRHRSGSYQASVQSLVHHEGTRHGDGTFHPPLDHRQSSWSHLGDRGARGEARPFVLWY
jgi:hypothetical protein